MTLKEVFGSKAQWKVIASHVAILGLTMTAGFNAQAQEQKKQGIKIERLGYNPAPGQPEFRIKNFLPGGRVMEIDINKMTRTGKETLGYLAQFDPCLYYTPQELARLTPQEKKAYEKTQDNISKMAGSPNPTLVGMTRNHLQSSGVPPKLIDMITEEGRKLLPDAQP